MGARIGAEAVVPRIEAAVHPVVPHIEAVVVRIEAVAEVEQRIEVVVPSAAALRLVQAPALSLVVAAAG